MSILTYNGVTLPYATSVQFSETGVGDDLSDTDWCYTKYDITVTCIINSSYLALLASQLQIAGGVGAPGLSPADIMAVVHTKLLQRRRALSYTFNGRQLIPQPQAGNNGTADAKNGPVPQYCNIFDLNNQSFLMQYRIVAHYWENNSVNSQGNPVVTNNPGQTVLYNRWSETEDVDNCLFVKRTRNGKYVIRSDNTQGTTVDRVRKGLVALALPSGFLRQSQKYTIDPSGLGLSYTITDVQQYKMPPVLADGTTAYEGTGTYTERYGAAASWASRIGTVNVQLKGSINTNQDLLTAAAIRICMVKLIANSIDREGVFVNDANSFAKGGVVLSANLSSDMYRNIVRATVTARLQGVRSRIQGMMGGAKLAFNITPFSDGDSKGGATTNVPDYSAVWGVGQGPLLQAANYYDPSVGNAMLNALGNLTTGFAIGTAGKNKEQ